MPEKSPSRSPARKRPAPRTAGPHLRSKTVRISAAVAAHVRSGHPYIYREALGERVLSFATGDLIEIVDESGQFIARALYDEKSTLALRVFSRNPNSSLAAGLIADRVRRAVALRNSLGIAIPDGAYRLLHAEGDGFPGITVDRYGDYLLAHLYTPASEGLAALAYDALEEQLQPRAIYEQRRYQPLTGQNAPQGSKLVRGTAAPLEINVHEYDATFSVDVTAPLGTGLFLDLREGRQRVRHYARERRVLNLFSYTGAISLWADRGGATQITSVDLAQKAHARARRNLALNELDEKRHEFIVGDTFSVLAQMQNAGRQFDLVILDPPSFSQSRGKNFSSEKDYRELVEAALGVIANGGILVAASNTLRFTAEAFDRAIGDAASRAGRYLRIVERVGLPVDFPLLPGFYESHYLKFAIGIVGG